MKKKDPYLEELDEMNDLEGETPDEEPTRIDFPSEPAAKEEEEAPSPREGASAKDLIGLAPDIPVQVVVVMGRKGVTVKDLLALKTGQVIDMDKVPTEPVDIVASGRVIAKGELVEVDGKLGVRILKMLK